MIDLSDGLAGDAAHLAAASKVALHVDIELLPLEAGLVEWAGPTANAALTAAAGGEDYELLAAMPPGFGSRDASAMQEETGVCLTRIGEVTTGEGVHLRLAGKPVVVSSFDHFT
jgi:thiamine-monophosphate kinase